MKLKSLRRSGFTLVEIMIVVAIIGLLATIAIPNFLKARVSAQRSACINNLKQIDGAKQIWATENRAAATTVPTIAQIQPYLGRGTAGTAPTCPSDPAASFPTSYNVQDLGTSPTCIIMPGNPGDTTGHRLD